jgi:hypothetical protein
MAENISLAQPIDESGQQLAIAPQTISPQTVLALHQQKKTRTQDNTRYSPVEVKPDYLTLVHHTITPG